MTTEAPAWAEKYSTETLYLALTAGYNVIRDPAYIFDTQKIAAIQQWVNEITAEIARREEAEE